jgi:hypothetical protein
MINKLKNSFYKIVEVKMLSRDSMDYDSSFIADYPFAYHIITKILPEYDESGEGIDELLYDLLTFVPNNVLEKFLKVVCKDNVKLSDIN